MGYWTSGAGLWGDGPADEVDASLEEIYQELGRVPSEEELLEMFSLAADGLVEAPVIGVLQDGLTKARAEFRADIGREPSPGELRQGFIFSLGALEYARERFASSQVTL